MKNRRFCNSINHLASPDILESRPGFTRAFLPDAISRINWLSIDDPLVLLQARGVLREGGLVLGFIDLATKVSKKTAEVDFLGRRIRASYALPYLAAIANTPIMSVSLTSESGPRFTLRLGQPLPAPARDEQAIQRTLQLLFRDAERQVLDHRDQWLGWRQWQSEAAGHPHPAPSLGNIVPAH